MEWTFTVSLDSRNKLTQHHNPPCTSTHSPTCTLCTLLLGRSGQHLLMKHSRDWFIALLLSPLTLMQCLKLSTEGRHSLTFNPFTSSHRKPVLLSTKRTKPSNITDMIYSPTSSPPALPLLLHSGGMKVDAHFQSTLMVYNTIEGSAVYPLPHTYNPNAKDCPDPCDGKGCGGMPRPSFLAVFGLPKYPPPSPPP